MHLLLRHHFRDLGQYYITNFFSVLAKQLQNKYDDITFETITDPSYEQNGYGSIHSCMHMSILNPKNDKYIVISFFDNWKYLFMQHLGWKPDKMTKMFYCGGFNFLDYFSFKERENNNPDVLLPDNIDELYHSFAYNPYNHYYDDQIDNIFKCYNIGNAIPSLYFRGYMWDCRQNMTRDIQDESILIIDKNTSDNDLPYDQYLYDLSKYKCALSLPGGTEICNRDIECFGVGVPVIRPTLSTNYPDPLIPNYHYISCYDNCKYWSGEPYYMSYTDFRDNLVLTWNMVKNNNEYLTFISNNARKWYEKNCGMTNNINYILSNINLEELYYG